MEQNPHVVFFFMNGCPHCEHTRPMWDAVKGDIEAEGMKALEFEASSMPAGVDVTGFPNIQKTDASGVVVVTIEGSPKNEQELRSKLGLKSKKKKGSSRKTRRARRRNIRSRRR